VQGDSQVFDRKRAYIAAKESSQVVFLLFRRIQGQQITLVMVDLHTREMFKTSKQKLKVSGLL